MKRILILCGIAVLLSASPLAADEVAHGWQSLFNGKTLHGWKANETYPVWTVKDRAIVGHGKRCHLFYTEEEFKNFELKVDVMLAPGSNSGIYFHTQYLDSGWPKAGYEVQLNNTHGDPVKTGSLYGVVKLYETPAKDNEWFNMHITVRGQNVVVRVNGKIVLDYTEPRGIQGDRKIGKGLIAFQQHDPKSLVRFRNVMLKKLPGD